MITYPDEFMIMNENKFVCRAIDNRMGGFMIAEVARLLHEQKKKLPFGLYIVNAVQEEVGLRGAHVSATKFQPELFFAVDCSPAGDIYGNQGKIGDGTLFRFYDPGHIMLKGDEALTEDDIVKGAKIEIY